MRFLYRLGPGHHRREMDGLTVIFRLVLGPDLLHGYVGRVLAATMIGCAPNWGAALDRAYQADFANGANLMTITGGHQIDALCHCLGDFPELSAFAVSQRDPIVTHDQGQVAFTSPDQLAVSGILHTR